MKVHHLIIGLIIAAIIGYMIFTSLSHTMVYYLTVSEFLEEKSETGCRINGKVVKGSIQHEGQTFNYFFKITDGKSELPVFYKGVTSDIFQDEIEVVVEGKYDKKSQVFQATTLITKCPSKYEAQEKDKKK
ncbi:MAG: hypothetical protein A2Y62_00680 [Candidatus Fischerbacteria bacterium RBG_13_37_8]|uniref:Cytochrome c biogenesis protein CcmE n=1 Tax=Candidatus Fischerbacteria bacterium RBG_13_37_8 TaxID=1817863 RepID=A0A1F5VPK5_9BACT|nr:MAG: hypothetical protein A2Y62_00680 [Candidatus Fischerbacteria bacterium RBG_13_37_8]